MGIKYKHLREAWIQHDASWVGAEQVAVSYDSPEGVKATAYRGQMGKSAGPKKDM